MALNGITLHALTRELKEQLEGGRIVKIAQPEPEELILTIKNNGQKHLLQISANASLPLIYLTSANKKAPLTAPNFCMLLRKHLQGAKILGVDTPGLERIIRIRVSHLDEMGDVAERSLNIEIMGKYSNIILIDDKNMVLDSIKRVSMLVSSVREVLPGKEYFIPSQEGRELWGEKKGSNRMHRQPSQP